MKHSEAINEIAAALAKAQGQYKPVPKNKTAKVKTKAGYEYSYKYADWADVLSMAIPFLSANNLALTQYIRQGEMPAFYQNDKHEVIEIVAPAYLQSRLMHSSGQWMESEGVLITQQDDKQAFGSELSYARRYDGCSLLGIMPDEDEDGKIATDNVRSRAKAAPPAKAPDAGATRSTAAQKPEPNGASPILTNEQRKTLLFDECYNIGGNNDVILAAIRKVTGQVSSKLVRMNQVEAIKREVYYATGGERPIEKIDLPGGEIIP